MCDLCVFHRYIKWLIIDIYRLYCERFPVCHNRMPSWSVQTGILLRNCKTSVSADLILVVSLYCGLAHVTLVRLLLHAERRRISVTSATARNIII